MGLDARAICHVVVKFLGLELLYQTKWHFLYLTLLSLKLKQRIRRILSNRRILRSKTLSQMIHANNLYPVPLINAKKSYVF